jgi:lipoyl(octanoyl) transferase
MGYREAFALQKRLVEQVASQALPSLLLRVEHDPVYTLGANFHAENLPLPASEYERMGIAIEQTDRGGDITFHGPNQLVLYPIFNLAHFGKDLHRYLRNLEEAVIVAMNDYRLTARRFPPHTGVWIEDRKICAIGIKVRRWTTLHGIALNCNNDLAPFQWIVPCGIKGYGVTSLSMETGSEITPEDAHTTLLKSFGTVFGIDVHNRTVPQLMQELEKAEADASLGSTADSA